METIRPDAHPDRRGPSRAPGYYLTGHQVSLNYFFIFALGMLGADLVVRGRALRSVQWVCWASFIGYLVVLRYNKVYISDFFIGIFAATLMAALTLGAMTPIRRVLSGRAITWLGTFSYSIYLVHSIIQQGYLRTGFLREPGPKETNVSDVFLYYPMCGYNRLSLLFSGRETFYRPRKECAFDRHNTVDKRLLYPAA